MKTNFFSIAIFTMFLATTVTAAERQIDAPRPSCCAKSENAMSPLSDRSLYQLEATWTNDQRQQIPLSSLRGKPQIVTMFFAHCQYACPLLVYKMKQLEAALPQNLRTNVGFTLVSFDSDRDTPDVLQTYRTQQQLGNNWTLLHGNADNVLELAALLGVKFKADAQGQFNHSNVITLLNAEGEIAYQETGLNLQTDELVHQIEKLITNLKTHVQTGNVASQ